MIDRIQPCAARSLVLCAIMAAGAAAAGELRLFAAPNAGGGWQTGAVGRCLGAIGQAVAFSASTSSLHRARAGTVLAPLLHPALDVDGNGIPDEDDPDDDADGLSDRLEIAGAAFDPITPTGSQNRDTDGDGIDDGGEAAAGTDPTNPAAFLRILSAERISAGVRIEWMARGGRSYAVVAATNAPALAGSPPAGVAAAGTGTGAWQVTTAAATSALPSRAIFLFVKPQP